MSTGRSVIAATVEACVIDGVFEAQQGGEEPVRFREAVLTDADIQVVQARVRQRVLRWFVRQG